MSVSNGRSRGPNGVLSLPSGLGSRHAAAAGITAYTKAIAITVSESDGTVRVWRAGKEFASFEPSRRR